jgi:hypothetical protein
MTFSKYTHVCKACHLPVMTSYVDKASNAEIYKEIDELFTPEHASRVKKILQGTGWMKTCNYDYKFKRKQYSTYIKQTLVLTEETPRGFTVLKPTTQFLAAHDGNNFVEPRAAKYSLYHTACKEETREFSDWQLKMARHVSYNSSNIVHVICSILGVNEEPRKARLQKTADYKFDLLEFLLTRSPESYKLFIERQRYMYGDDSNDSDEECSKPSDRCIFKFDIDPNNILLPKFQKMLGLNNAKILNNVKMEIECNKAVVDKISAFPKTSSTKTTSKPAKHKLDQTILFSGFRDVGLNKYITEHGGVVKSSLTKKVTLVIIKTPTTTNASVKLAEERGIPIVTLDEFKLKLTYDTT